MMSSDYTDRFTILEVKDNHLWVKDKDTGEIAEYVAIDISRVIRAQYPNEEGTRYTTNAGEIIDRDGTSSWNGVEVYRYSSQWFKNAILLDLETGKRLKSGKYYFPGAKLYVNIGSNPTHMYRSKNTLEPFRQLNASEEVRVLDEDVETIDSDGEQLLRRWLKCETSDSTNGYVLRSDVDTNTFIYK